MIHGSRTDSDPETMGAAATKEDDKESRNRAIRTKVRALAAFNPIPGKKGKDTGQEATPEAAAVSRRDELLGFIKERREEKLESWDRLQKGYTGESVSEEMYACPAQPLCNEQDGDCEVCGVCGESGMSDMMPCRICGRRYHRKCLVRSGLYTDHEIGFFDRAGTRIGWSCLKCDNIFNLLTSSELDELSNDFERLDVNKDASISLEEFLEHRRRLRAREDKQEMTDEEEEEEFERLQFKFLDADGGGSVEYSEYLKHYACLRLATRPKAELVAMLTAQERRCARVIFQSLDLDCVGQVTSENARHAYRSWYTDLFTKLIDDGDVSRNAVTDLGALKASLVVDVGDDPSQALDWQEFLEQRAIYIISSRPNNAAALYGKK